MPSKNLLNSISKKKRTKMPEDIEPMLATLVDEAPTNNGQWLYEIKWDGFRMLAYLNGTQVDLRSRNNKIFDDKFYPVHNALKELNIKAVFDGEVIVENDEGLPDFSALQLWRSEADGDLVYYVFDILWYNGYNLMNTKLIDRKEILDRLFPKNDAMIRHSEAFKTAPKNLFEFVNRMGLEGLIAKKSSSIYMPGTRTKEWLKIKMQRHQEVVIGGFTRNEGSPKKFSALLAGVWQNGELIPVTPIGTGFNARMQTEIMDKLTPLITTKCPFVIEPDYNKPSRFRPNPPRAEITWVKPLVVGEIAYRTISSDGSYRHPSFKGLREDKDPKSVVPELPIETGKILETDILPMKEKKFIGKKAARKTLLNPTDETQVRIVNGHELKFSNLSKAFWPKDNITKRDMINYYYRVAPFMVSYLKGRPQTLNRYPNGINKDSFYQKDVRGKVPSWINTFNYFSFADQREKEFLVCDEEASLLYVANLGCIEINTWHSTTEKPSHPDYCIIDLDPDKNPFNEVIETANVTKQLLESIDVPSFCKTSGSTGLHIYIPLNAKYSYEESKEFARAIAKKIHAEVPKFTSIERKTKDRKSKLYIDFLQNRPQATVAAPYSLRPKPGAPVSMPLDWSEVKKGLKITDFNIHNALDRLIEMGDIFKGILGKGIDIQKAMEKLNNM